MSQPTATINARDSDSAGGLRPSDFPFGVLAMFGTLALLGGIAVYARRPSRHDVTTSRDALIAYLRDHLTGSDTALRVVQRLSTTRHGVHDVLFHRLSREFENERTIVSALLVRLGSSGRSVKRAAGVASGVVLSMAAGGAEGELSMFRTLEGLAVGVQGKRCMWRVLQRTTTPSSVPSVDYVELEAMAVRQWEAIEERRLRSGRQTFADIAPPES